MALNYRLNSLNDIIQYVSGIDIEDLQSPIEFEEKDSFDINIHPVTDEVVAAIRTISNLRKVSLSKPIEKCEPEKAADFISALNHNSKLESLVFSECEVGRDGLHALGRILSDPQSVLKELRITHGSCTDDVIGCLYYDLIKSKSLKMLSLEDNNDIAGGDKPITAWGFRMLSDVLASSHSVLTELDLTDCDISNACNTELFSGLATNSRIQKLILSRNKINLENAMKLSTGLESNKALLCLDLSGCSIDDISAKALSAGLARNSSLKDLSLSHLNGMTLSSWSVLLSSLRISGMPLENLCLGNNNISDEAIFDVMNVLKGKSETLILFGFQRVELSHDGWKMIARAFLTPMPKLEQAYVGNAHFDDDVAMAFVKYLKDQPSFAHFYHCNSSLTDEGLEAIRTLGK